VSDASPFDAIVGRILDGQAPLNVRAAAARGALPLPRATLIQLYVRLLGDEDEGVRGAARQSLDGLSREAVGEALGDPASRPEVMAHFARLAAREEALAEKLAFHADVPAEALEVLASAGNAAVLDLVLTNQERLLAQPALLEKLMLNPALRAEQRGRILELLGRVARLEQREAEDGKQAPDGIVGDADLEETARLLDVDVGDLLSHSEIMDGQEFAESEDPEIRNTYQRIITLNAAQKAILAMKGGREERMILIRDTNKVVALAVLKNGRITEQEVESIARMRNVSDEVLRQVGSSREWTKNYPVIIALVNNPRTPQRISTNFISRLTNRDLKNLYMSRDIPELIRRMARRTYNVRTQPQSGNLRKK